MGIRLEPQEHLGSEASALENKGIPTDAGTRNEQKQNRWIRFELEEQRRLERLEAAKLLWELRSRHKSQRDRARLLLIAKRLRSAAQHRFEAATLEHEIVRMKSRADHIAMVNGRLMRDAKTGRPGAETRKLTTATEAYYKAIDHIEFVDSAFRDEITLVKDLREQARLDLEECGELRNGMTIGGYSSMTYANQSAVIAPPVDIAPPESSAKGPLQSQEQKKPLLETTPLPSHSARGQALPHTFSAPLPQKQTLDITASSWLNAAKRIRPVLATENGYVQIARDDRPPPWNNHTEIQAELRKLFAMQTADIDAIHTFIIQSPYRLVFDERAKASINRPTEAELEVAAALARYALEKSVNQALEAVRTSREVAAVRAVSKDSSHPEHEPEAISMARQPLSATAAEGQILPKVVAATLALASAPEATDGSNVNKRASVAEVETYRKTQPALQKLPNPPGSTRSDAPIGSAVSSEVERPEVKAAHQPTPSLTGINRADVPAAVNAVTPAEAPALVPRQAIGASALDTSALPGGRPAVAVRPVDSGRATRIHEHQDEQQRGRQDASPATSGMKAPSLSAFSEPNPSAQAFPDVPAPSSFDAEATIRRIEAGGFDLTIGKDELVPAEMLLTCGVPPEQTKDFQQNARIMAVADAQIRNAIRMLDIALQTKRAKFTGKPDGIPALAENAPRHIRTAWQRHSVSSAFQQGISKLHAKYSINPAPSIPETAISPPSVSADSSQNSGAHQAASTTVPAENASADSGSPSAPAVNPAALAAMRARWQHGL